MFFTPAGASRLARLQMRRLIDDLRLDDGVSRCRPYVRRNNPLPFFTLTLFSPVLVTQFWRARVGMQSDVHMSDERAVIASKFQRARYVISIKARSHNYAARGKPVSKYRNEYFPILCSWGKNYERETVDRGREGEGRRQADRKPGRGRERENAAVFIEFAKNIFVFRVLPRTPSAFLFLSGSLFLSPSLWFFFYSRPLCCQ